MNESTGSTDWWKRGSLLVLCLAGVAGLWLSGGEMLSLDSLAAREVELRAGLAEAPLRTFTLAFVIYVVTTGFSLPGAAILTLVIAWLFGFWPALLLVSFASTTGATVAFLLTRYLLREAVTRRLGTRFSRVREQLERDGAWYLLTLRLIPAIPFFAINLLMGLVPMRVTTFWWVSQAGMLPGTAVYVYAGTTLPSLQVLRERGGVAVLSPQLFAALAALGLFPLLMRRLLAHRLPDRHLSPKPDSE